MTAVDALASMREDLDRLEKKGLMKPGYFHRKRAEIAAIESELAALATMVDRAEFTAAEQHLQHADTDLRLGMLANVLSMVGIDPMPHLRRPLSDNPDIYHDAAQWVHAIRQRAGMLNRPLRYTLDQLRTIVSHAIWTVRLHHRLTPTEPLPTDPYAFTQEESQAAA